MGAALKASTDNEGIRMACDELMKGRGPQKVAALRAVLRCGRMLSPWQLHTVGVGLLTPIVVMVWHLSLAPLVYQIGIAHDALKRAESERVIVDKARLELAHMQAVLRQINHEREGGDRIEPTSKMFVVEQSEALAVHAKTTLRSVEAERDPSTLEERFVVVFEGKFETIFAVLEQLEDSLRGMLLIDTELTTGSYDDSRIRLKLVVLSPASQPRTRGCE